ncbi:MAG: molybdopterin-dependent oxidoreductase [Oscillospiraceae bacterium]|nr:molybdopterin-dependent oxidoreductase [Oscillospiraceae bacterium]
MKKFLAILCAVGLAVGLLACAADTPLDFTVLDDIIITVHTPEGFFIDLAAHALHNGEFDVVELDTISIDARGEQRHVQARGVLLEDILQANGLTQHDFAAITASGADGYFIAIPADMLRNRDVLLAYYMNGEVIDPRVVIPDERLMFWVKYLRELELVPHGAAMEVTREVDFAELLAELEEYTEVFWHEGAETQALPIAAMLAHLGEPHGDFVIIIAEDGLVKTERFSTFSQQLIVFAGTELAPLFIGPSLPVGMRVHGMASVQIGEFLVEF